MIKKLLLATLITFGMTNELGTSFSVRTPNDDDKPLDYEYSIKVEDTEGNVQYLLKRDWERELGEKYIDDIAKFSHKFLDCFYYGVDYVDKESKDIFYTTYNIGVHSNGFKLGLSVKDEDKLASFGYNKKFKKDGLEYKVGISLKSNFDDSDILNIKSEIKKWLSEKVNIFGLYKHEYYNEQEDFQFKVGIGVKI